MTYLPDAKRCPNRVSRPRRARRLRGGGQVVVQGNYAYVGHMDPAERDLDHRRVESAESKSGEPAHA